MFGLIW
jgi:hypothetical protein